MITNIDEIYTLEKQTYRGFELKIFYEYAYDPYMSKYHCIACSKSRLEQVRDPNGILQVIRHEPDKIEFDISSKDVMDNPAYDNNPALAVIDVFHYKVDEFLKPKEIKQLTNIKTYHCACCGTTYTTDKLGYTPACRNCGALMKESV